MRLFFLFLIVTFYCHSIEAQNQNNNCACCTENHNAFDFWVGHWTSATAGYTGTSHNFYNTTTKQWEQLWIDNQGGSLHLKGNRIDNKMILKTDEQTNTNGQKFYHRVTWTLNNDGTVRQFMGDSY